MDGNMAAPKRAEAPGLSVRGLQAHDLEFFLRGSTLSSYPRTAEFTSLFLGGAAPNAGVLVGGESELKTRLFRGTVVTNGAGVVDLLNRRTGGADGEKQVRIGVTARSSESPVVIERERTRLEGKCHGQPPGKYGEELGVVIRFTCAL